MTYRVLIATTLSNAGLTLLQGEIGGLAQNIEPNRIAEYAQLSSVEALIIRDEITIDSALLDKMPALRVIGRLGTSIAEIDIEDATRRGIIVMNTPGINAISVAEYTFALMLAFTRHMVDAAQAAQAGKWEREPYVGTELHGKTLGIIGLGRVGKQVAQRAIAFGMRVLAYDPYVDEAALQGIPIKLVGLPELITSSDFVSIHAAYTKETHHMLNDELFSIAKPGAVIVNVAHSNIIDEDALLTYLDNNRLRGAALDVVQNMPPSSESKVLQHPKILVTPHLGDSTQETMHDLGLIIVQQVLDALAGHDYRNVVNMPIMDGHPFELILPYLKLAEAIGKLQHSLARGTIQRVVMEFKGDEFQELVKPMTVAFLRGLLVPMLGSDSVNYINAPILAQERNIFVTQAKGLANPGYSNLLTNQVQWAGGDLTISGALFNHTDPHIVQIDQYRCDIIPNGTLLIMGSHDRPGVIGKVGSLLGENNINIADWRTGRAERGGNTLSFLMLDEPLPNHLLDLLHEQEFVRHATQITF